MVLHAAVQQVVFFRVILENAAEGLHSRGGSPGQAAVGAVPVAVLLFVLMHELTTPLRVLDLAEAGGVFGLLYLHTGESAVGIGAHSATLYVGPVVSAIIRVRGSLSGILGTLDQTGIPALVGAYLVLVAWRLWFDGELSIHGGIARWMGD